MDKEKVPDNLNKNKFDTVNDDIKGGTDLNKELQDLDNTKKE